MTYSISIFGSSSGRNAGDAALLAGIMGEIDAATGERLIYEIPTYRPEFIWHTYPNKTRPVSMLPWHGSIGMFGPLALQSVLRCNMNLVYDAMLFDRGLCNPLKNYMPAVRYLFPLAKKKGRILGCYNVGCGPVDTEAGRRMLGEIGGFMDFITVRDEDSRALLIDLGVEQEKIVVTADAALTVPGSGAQRIQAILNSLHLGSAKEILAINVNSYLNSWTKPGQKTILAEDFCAQYGEALTIVSKQLNVPLLFVCTQHSDIAITKQVMAKVNGAPQMAIFTNVEHSPYDIKGVLGRVSLLCAMRLHANILCTSALTPAVALIFQKKVESYYKLLGLGDNLMSFDGFSAKALSDHILKGWNNRAAIRAQLQQRIPELQERSRIAARIVAAIVRGEGVEGALRSNR